MIEEKRNIFWARTSRCSRKKKSRKEDKPYQSKKDYFQKTVNHKQQEASKNHGEDNKPEKCSEADEEGRKPGFNKLSYEEKMKTTSPRRVKF